MTSQSVIDKHIEVAQQELGKMKELAGNHGLGYVDGVAFNIHSQVGQLEALLAIVQLLRDWKPDA